MGAPFWSHWCRLCAKDSNEFKVDLEDLDSNIINALRKYFEVKISWDDNLSTKLCSCCNKLLNDLIDFSTRVNKVKTLFEVLRFFDTNKTVDVKALRQHWGLEELSLAVKEDEVEQGNINAAVEKLIDAQNVETDGILKDSAATSEAENEKPFGSQIEDSQVASSPGGTIKGDYSSSEDFASDDDDDWILPSGSAVVSINLPSKELRITSSAQRTDKSKANPTDTNDVALKEERQSSDSENSEPTEKSKSKFKPLACKKCGKIYTRLSYYEQHVLECNGEQKKRVKIQSTCHICNKKLVSKKSLYWHLKFVHENVRKYVCDTCGKALRTARCLQKHQLVHTDERPHLCPVCNKAYKTLEHLKNHSQTHGEPNFQCDICGKKIKTRKDLNHHKLRHGEARFRCELCGRMAATSHGHKQHMLIHIGAKPFFCKYCDKTFSTNKACLTHKLRFHREEYDQDADRDASTRLPLPPMKDLRDMIHKMAKNTEEKSK